MVLKPEGMYPEKLFHLHKLLIIAALIFFLNSIKKGLKFGVDWIILYTKISNWADYGSAAFDRYKIIPHYETELLIQSWRDNSCGLQVRQDEAEPWESIPVGHKAQDVPRSCSQHLGQDGMRSHQLILRWSKSLISVAFLVSVLLNSFPECSSMKHTVSPDLLWFSFLLLLPRAWIQPVSNP